MTINFKEVLFGCVIWTLILVPLKSFVFDRSAQEIFTAVYYMWGGAFGVLFVAWRRTVSSHR
jgi:hypothetical protein